jgi:hypothetical protein
MRRSSADQPADQTQPDPDVGTGRRDQQEHDQTPHWELDVSPSGVLTATLTGTCPPLKVSASDLKSLRKKVRETVMRGML